MPLGTFIRLKYHSTIRNNFFPINSFESHIDNGTLPTNQPTWPLKFLIKLLNKLIYRIYHWNWEENAFNNFTVGFISTPRVVHCGPQLWLVIRHASKRVRQRQNILNEIAKADKKNKSVDLNRITNFNYRVNIS